MTRDVDPKHNKTPSYTPAHLPKSGGGGVPSCYSGDQSHHPVSLTHPTPGTSL